THRSVVTGPGPGARAGAGGNLPWMTDQLVEEQPPRGHVRMVYRGPVAPHWDVVRGFGDQTAIEEFRQRVDARLQLLPPHDPQFRGNRERVVPDAEREHLALEWDLGDGPE